VPYLSTYSEFNGQSIACWQPTLERLESVDGGEAYSAR
jgi:hypothetical protein